MKLYKKAAILGGGNIGQAIANGLVSSNLFTEANIYITKRRIDTIKNFSERGFITTQDNRSAVRDAEIIIIAVQPKQLDEILQEIKSEIKEEKHLVISVVSGASIMAIKELLRKNIPVVRAMPNTAIAIGESMTCISSDIKTNGAIKIAEEIFSSVGKTMIIEEDLMVPATALCACGIAFFLRAIRAASQGGIEIGFHSEEAIFMAAQTAKGAASLLLNNDAHPESEIDKVTTPRGITISGLNQMEHNGFSSAMIKGLVTSAEKASKLYKNE